MPSGTAVRAATTLTCKSLAILKENRPAAEHPNFDRDIALFEQSLSQERPTKFQRCLRLADDPFELKPNPESVSEPSATRSFELKGICALPKSLST